MSDYIPDHLLVNVFLRLPFDSLIRSRCVSKSWRSLIDDTHFIRVHFDKYHLQTNSNSNDGIKIIALIEETLSAFIPPKSRAFYSLDMNLLFSSKIATAKQHNLAIGFLRDDNAIRLVGYYNGLLCLVDSDCNIFFWNPWIQKYWEIPPPPYGNLTGLKEQIRLGFGYDHINDDYKVVAFKKGRSCQDQLVPSSTLISNKVYVYGSKLNSWREICDFPFEGPMYHEPIDGILANGALHWVGGVNSIIAFDLSSGKFRLMLCPYWEDRFYPKLTILNGFLCLVSYGYFGGQRFADILVMEDYGIDESCWTKLGTIKIPFDEWINWVSIKPVACSQNKKQLVLQVCNAKLVVYDLETNSFSDVAMSGAATCIDSRLRLGLLRLDSCVCVGSLVSPF